MQLHEPERLLSKEARAPGWRNAVWGDSPAGQSGTQQLRFSLSVSLQVTIFGRHRVACAGALASFENSSSILDRMGSISCCKSNLLVGNVKREKGKCPTVAACMHQEKKNLKIRSPEKVLSSVSRHNSKTKSQAALKSTATHRVWRSTNSASVYSSSTLEEYRTRPFLHSCTQTSLLPLSTYHTPRNTELNTILNETSLTFYLHLLKTQCNQTEPLRNTPNSGIFKKNKRGGVQGGRKLLSDLCPAPHYWLFCSNTQQKIGRHADCQGAEI